MRSESNSISDLMGALSDQATRLARLEVELAKAEVSEKGKRFGLGVGAFGAAGLVAVLGLGALVAAAIMALALAMDAWIAALIVAVALLAVAGLLALVGRQKVREAGPPVPEQTVETVREDVEVAKRSAKQGRIQGGRA